VEPGEDGQAGSLSESSGHSQGAASSKEPVNLAALSRAASSSFLSGTEKNWGDSSPEILDKIRTEA